MAEKPRLASKAEQQKPETKTPATQAGEQAEALSPTRYGDWEKHGRCIDF